MFILRIRCLACHLSRLSGNPGASVEAAIRDVKTYYKSQEYRDHWLEGFRKAGLLV